MAKTETPPESKAPAAPDRYQDGFRAGLREGAKLIRKAQRLPRVLGGLGVQGFTDRREEFARMLEAAAK